MPRTEVTGNQVKDESLTSADIAAAGVRGSTANQGTQRELEQGTVSDVDLRDDAVTSAKLDETDDYTLNSLVLTTTLSVTTTSTLTGDVGIGAAPVTDSALAVTSTTKAFLLPRMTTIQMNAITTPLNGMQIFDTTLSQFMGYNGTSWVMLG